MKGRQLMFFATFQDFAQILLNIELNIDLKYYKTGLVSCIDIPTYNSIFNTPNLAITHSGDWNNIDEYLVMKNLTNLKVEDVPQRKGGTKYDVNQIYNPDSIEIKLGGIFQHKENVIVAGRVSTISISDVSNELYKIFSSKIKSNFKKIGAFYVGKNAEEKMQQGWRLVTNEKMPKEFDLAYS
jgi:hypothetical protein